MFGIRSYSGWFVCMYSDSINLIPEEYALKHEINGDLKNEIFNLAGCLEKRGGQHSLSC